MSASPEPQLELPDDAPRRALLSLAGVAAALAVVALVVSMLADVPGIEPVAPSRAGAQSFAPTNDGGDSPALTPAPPKEPTASDGPQRARLTAATVLRDQPGGRLLKRIGLRTEFNSARVLPVVERRGDWLGVLATERSNKVSWIPARNATLSRSPVALELDLSARRITVRRNGRVVQRFLVGIGRPQTPTPVGRYGVTDKLRVEDPASPYGCCILALSGKQTQGLEGWPGGDRLAIHATSNASNLGQAVSHGCMRADAGVARGLLQSIPLGSVLRVKA